jgi:hypothetical protein
MHGDPKASDAVTIEHVEVATRKGKVIKPVYVPLRPSSPEESSSSNRMDVDEGFAAADDLRDDIRPPRQNMVRRKFR